MDTHIAAELRVLRERAYGPHADIHRDAAAVRRLRQLEEGALRAEPPESGPTEHAASERLPHTPPSENAPSSTSHPNPTPALERSVRRTPRLRMPVLWVASVIVAILVTVVISNAVIQGVHSDPLNAGATQVAALEEDPGWELPEFFGFNDQSDSARGFAEFYGLRAVVQTTGYMTGPAYDECVSVMTSADAATATANAFDGPFWVGCAANSFPAAAAFKVTAEAPDQLRAAFPEGTALQFVFDEAGGDVVVFSSAATSPESER